MVVRGRLELPIRGFSDSKINNPQESLKSFFYNAPMPDFFEELK
jgi:hypothetical protein